LFDTNNTNIGNASSSSNTTSTSITISNDDCERAKVVCQKTLKYGAAAACFGAGYGAKALYDVFTNSSGRSPHNYDGGSTTTGTPWRSPWNNESAGIGQFDLSMNKDKIY
jgi:hypothetical protein